MSDRYGVCEECQTPLEPVWFTEDQYVIIGGYRCKTGRQRTACSHLICPCCLKKYVVDDSFDGPWN